ncbi:MAG: transcription antitermination factor NusB [Bacteriovoracaceae bacterium]|nr:transcription antitermination factor NusB [Bacteriovoracaceae bacterium]
MNTRREAREFCLQFLYHFQLPVFQEQKKSLSQDKTELFERITQFRETLNVSMGSQELAWVSTIVNGILKNSEELETLITKHLKNWKLQRLSRIEHTLLVLAAFELKYQPQTPFKVVINEAIELGKKYSTKESGPFLNGVLDGLARDLGHDA